MNEYDRAAEDDRNTVAAWAAIPPADFIPEPTCPVCLFVVPICTSNTQPGLHWARHTILGELTSGDSPECRNSGQPWQRETTSAP